MGHVQGLKYCWICLSAQFSRLVTLPRFLTSFIAFLPWDWQGSYSRGETDRLERAGDSEIPAFGEGIPEKWISAFTEKFSGLEQINHIWFKDNAEKGWLHKNWTNKRSSDIEVRVLEMKLEFQNAHLVSKRNHKTLAELGQSREADKTNGRNKQTLHKLKMCGWSKQNGCAKIKKCVAGPELKIHGWPRAANTRLGKSWQSMVWAASWKTCS